MKSHLLAAASTPTVFQLLLRIVEKAGSAVDLESVSIKLARFEVERLTC